MIKDNLSFLVIIVLGLLVALAGFLMVEFFDRPDAYSMINYGIWGAELAGFFMLLANGTFIKSKYFRYAKGIFALVILGALFRILHWDYSAYLIMAGFLGIMICYVLHFIKKPVKKLLDYYKLAFVLIHYPMAVLRYLHVIGDDYLIMSSAIMWLAIIDYLKTKKRRGRLLD